ncbi:MAG TPA: thiamine pyrophosphate-dependent enzyme [Burkholderiales bacterium]|nr:thiamine pyrophosphate-dependent enzyme [Burkholderiales bacterium]
MAGLDRPELPTGKFALDSLGILLGALLPENAIVIDEAVSSGRGFARYTANVQPHDWVPNSGGSIGFALPVAAGAAIACPDRKVIALEGDGSGMYTLQALWTMARENLDVTVLIFANRSYNILRGELANVGAGTPGVRATDMLSLDRPDLDWLALAKGHGVEAGRAENLDELAVQFKRALARKGPYLIEVAM